MFEEYGDVIGVKDLCKILSITKKTAYKVLEDGTIPSRKIGRQYRISKKKIEEFMSE